LDFYIKNLKPQNFTFTITDEEIKKIKEYEKNQTIKEEDD